MNDIHQLEILKNLDYTKLQYSKANTTIYLLSERGYAKLIKIIFVENI